MVHSGTNGFPALHSGTTIHQSVGTNLTATVTCLMGTSCLGVRARIRIWNGSGSLFEFSPSAWVNVTRQRRADGMKKEL